MGGLMQTAIAKNPVLKKSITKRQSLHERKGIENSSAMTISLLVTAVVIFCFLFHVWSQIQVVNLGYEISRMNREKKELIQFNKKLKLEIATIKSPYHIEGIANKELKLTSPKRNQMVVIK